MQAVATAQDFKRGEMVVGRVFQSLRHAWRKSEGTSIRQIDDDPTTPLVVTGRCCARLRFLRNPAAFHGGVDFHIRQLNHGFASICPESLDAAR